MLNLNATQVNQIKILIDEFPVGVYQNLDLLNKIAKFYVPKDNEAKLWGHSDISEICLDALEKAGYSHSLHLSLSSEGHVNVLNRLQSFVKLDNSKIFYISTHTKFNKLYQNFIFVDRRDTLLKLRLFL